MATHCANIVPVLKPVTSVRQSKADIKIAKIEGTLGETKYCLCIDYRNLKQVIVAPSKICMTTLTDVRAFCRDKILSECNLKDFFFSIHLSEHAQKYTNFYYRDSKA